MSNNVPKLRFKGFNDEWKEKKLSDIANVTMGQSPSSSAYNENYNGIPLVQGNADIEKRKTIPRIYTSEITKTCEIEDIIMSVRAPVGSIARATSKCCIGRGVCAIKSNENQDYLYQVLLDNEDKWVKVSQGSTFESINRTDITGLKIKVPSLEEQEKIANFLTKVDKIIEKQEEKVSNLENYKKGMMQKIFSQEIRFKDENGEEYPEWKYKYLGQCCKVNTGKKDTQDKIEGGKYPFFVRSQTIEYINSYSYDGEAILTAGDGVGVGKVFHYVNCKFDYHQRVYKLSDFNGVNGRFLYEYFSKKFKKEVVKYNAKTSVDSVRLEMITKMKIPLPSLKEQTKIANFLSNIDVVVDKEKEKLEELILWKKGLLQQMFV